MSIVQSICPLRTLNVGSSKDQPSAEPSLNTPAPPADDKTAISNAATVTAIAAKDNDTAAAGDTTAAADKAGSKKRKKDAAREKKSNIEVGEDGTITVRDEANPHVYVTGLPPVSTRQNSLQYFH